jgi:tetratricopeptide (TPR) repeat protein
MMGLFYLLTMYCAIRSFTSRGGAGWSVAAVIFCAIGMGTKEVMATAPVMVLIYDRVFVARKWSEIFERRWKLHTALAATWILLIAVVWGGPRSTSAGFGLAMTPLQYAGGQCEVIVHYLRLAFYPHPLILDYAWKLPERLSQVLVPGAGLLVLLVAMVVALRRRAELGFLGVWFFMILAPTSSFVPIKDLAFEHRMYLSLAGVIVAVVIAVYLAGRGALRRGGTALAVGGLGLATAGVALLGWRTYLRNEDYRTPKRMWTQVVRNAPHNHRAHSNLGYAYRREDKYEEAIRHYDRALELNPAYARGYSNRGAAYGFMGEHERAMADFNRAIKVDPNMASGYYNRGMGWLIKGDFQKGIKDLDAAIRLNPNYAGAYVRRGEAYSLLGEHERALRDVDKALRIMPDLQEARQARGRILNRIAAQKRSQ